MIVPSGMRRTQLQMWCFVDLIARYGDKRHGSSDTDDPITQLRLCEPCFRMEGRRVIVFSEQEHAFDASRRSETSTLDMYLRNTILPD